MLKEDLIKDLRQFGLNEYEAKAYLALTVYGPLTASQISEKSKIPQSKVYEIMRSLITKSLAESWETKPRKFKAIEPVFGLKKIIEERRRKIEMLKKKSMMIVREIKPLNNNNGYELWTSKGKKAFLEKAVEIIERSNKFGYATTSRFSRYPLLDEAFLRALKRGVKIRMLGTDLLDNARRARASWYAKQGADVRILPMDIHPILGLGDDKEVCVRIDNPAECDFIWSNNPALINIMKTYFENLWEDAEKFKF
ncbi:MAG: TrmB family transcriptional regulator [Candidatus Aenigmatarchaeota archaeon]